MGAGNSKKKPIIKEVILSTPTTHPSGEVIFPSPGKQIVHGIDKHKKNAPLYLKKLHTWAWENAEHHHTKRFTLPKTGTLVVRRGQPFKLTLTFNRPYNSLTDELKFFFETGDNPLPDNDTMICLSSYTSQGSSGWKSDFLPIIGTKSMDCIKANLWIFTPPDCIVSDWKFSIQSILRSEKDTATATYDHPDRIYILFNPWCKADGVYLAAEPLLDEYIMNQAGIMFQGCRKRMTIKPWVFGQFEPGILEACIYILKRGFNFGTSRTMGDPVIVSRIIASVVNGENNNGVLLPEGSSGENKDGRLPSMWSGSINILKQYVDNALASKGGNPEPVKYGQCFVYAGLVTTICRALGIPCRCVTNYNSGRNNDGSLSLDFYYETKDDGTIEQMETANPNLVWVRSMIYLVNTERSISLVAVSLVKYYDTPSCGPAPLTAIKDGKTDINYDVGHIFSAVNADVLHWLKLDTGEWTVFQVEGSRVGHSISTKTPDGKPAKLTFKHNAAEMGRIRQIVTNEYKYKKAPHPSTNENSDSCAHIEIIHGEIQIKYAVLAYIKRRKEMLQSWVRTRTIAEEEVMQRFLKPERPIYKQKAKDVSFRLEEKEYEYIGEDFYVKASVVNESNSPRTIKALLMLESVHYSGKRHILIKKQVFSKTLEPDSKEMLQLGVYENEYIGKLAEHAGMKQYGLLRVEETNQLEAWVDDFLLQKPHLELVPDETVYRGKSFQVKISFKNPLHRSLTECMVNVEGVGLETMQYIRNIENVPAQCEWTGVVHLMPIRSKVVELSVTFHCKQMYDVVGAVTVKVDIEKEGEGEIDTINGKVEKPPDDVVLDR